METVKWKQINKKKIALRKLSHTTNGMEAPDDLYTDIHS